MKNEGKTIIYFDFQMADNWIKYICKFDMLLEEAIRVCVKNSLQNMYEALHGDGTTGPNPILRLEANLKQNRVCFFMISEIILSNSFENLLVLWR